jgi:Domain of unknown function (DUF1905)/Bacteriocin-protection, YdeI or OmpD-Associated
MKVHSFKGILENAVKGTDTAYVAVPINVEKFFGSRGQVKVKATFDGHPYRGVIANMGTGSHCIGVRKDVRKAIGKTIGDIVMVTIEEDLDERVLEITEDLRVFFKKNAHAREFFDTLSYTNRKEYVVWITSAKKQETREKRLLALLKKLHDKKKNPSEK